MARRYDYLITPGTRVEHSRRGGKASQRGERWMIEGVEYTTEELGTRLKVTPGRARERLREAQKLPGPVTWARLLKKEKS